MSKDLRENSPSFYVILTIFQIAIINSKTDAVAVDCASLNTCNYSQNIFIPNCYCDNSCKTFNDCCFDYKNSDTKFEDEPIEGDIQSFTNRLKCEELFRNNFGVLLISECLDASQEEATHGVIENSIPVTGENSIVYKNINIAKCNNQQQFKIWDVYFLFELCKEKVDFDMLKGMTVVELANAFINFGCEFKLIPPNGSIPRFCINFIKNETVCNSQRVPVLSSKAPRTYWNKECCERFDDQCDLCAKSGIYYNIQLYLRHTMSMTAILHIQGHGQHQERLSTYKGISSAKMSFHNANFAKMAVVSTLDDYEKMDLARAFFFVESCLRNTYNLDNLLMKYQMSITPRKVNGSRGGLFLCYVDVVIGDEKDARDILDIKQWVEGINITYTEKSEDRNTSFNIIFLPRSRKKIYTKSGDFTISLDDPVRSFRKDVEFLKDLLRHHDFPRSSCTDIYGQVNRIESQRSVVITCKNDMALISQITNEATGLDELSTIYLAYLLFIIIGKIRNK